MNLSAGCVGADRDESVRLCPPCRVEVGDPGSPTSIEVPGISRSNWVEVWDDGQWVCLVGLEAPEVVLAWPARRSLDVAFLLDRLDTTAMYDPGGLHRVTFHPLHLDDLLLIEHEHGVALLDAPSARMVWQQVHGDLTARVADADDEVVWLVGEAERFGYRLRDGRPVGITRDG